MGFYNTTGEYGDLLKEYERKAIQQDQLVLRVFQRSGKGLTSHEVEALLKFSLLRTSVVRSMNTLMKANLLEKTKKKRIGRYGRPVFVWRLKQKDGQIRMA